MTTPAQIRKAALALPDAVEVEKWVFAVRGAPVSYTHLTLPTILRV